MEVISLIYFMLVISLGVITTCSDYKYGLVHNKILKRFFVMSIPINIIYYMFIDTDNLKNFMVNILVIICISLIMFYTNLIAGGDSKLIIVLAFLIPSNFYVEVNSNYLTLCFVIGFALFYGYIYLFVMSLANIITGVNKLTSNSVKFMLVSFFKSFIRSMIYVVLINYTFGFLQIYGLKVEGWFIKIICVVTTLCLSKYPWMQAKCLVRVVFITDVILSLFFKTIPFSINPSSYAIVLLIVIAQIIIKTNLYKTVDIKDIKKGAILSTESSFYMQNSRIQGLPKVSDESIKSRLTETEIDSIKRWGNSRGINQVVVVRKIPFAVFITLGYLTYIVWGIFL